MKARTETVLRGFLALSASEKAELIEEMNAYLKKNRAEQAALQEAYKERRLVLGPLSETCPCCGR